DSDGLLRHLRVDRSRGNDAEGERGRSGEQSETLGHDSLHVDSLGSPRRTRGRDDRDCRRIEIRWLVAGVSEPRSRLREGFSGRRAWGMKRPRKAGAPDRQGRSKKWQRPAPAIALKISVLAR